MEHKTVLEPEEPVSKMQKVDTGYQGGIELNGNAACLKNNGVQVASEPMLRVKKLSLNAILPSRGSALAAGYDLSRCVFNAILFSHSLWLLFVFTLSTCWSLLSCSCSASSCVVPARGKALVPTDLSIAIPEGTYARIGNILP
jgi:hypothetical protein